MNRALPVHGIDPESTVADNAPLIIAARLQELLQWEPYIKDPARVSELHQMRIAAKRLRYTLEVFAPVMRGVIPPFVERLKVLQDLLGDIHDLDVITPILVRAARRALRVGQEGGAWQQMDVNGVLGLCSLCRRKLTARRRLHRQFRTEWRRLRKESLLERLADQPLLPGAVDPDTAHALGEEDADALVP